MAIGMLGVPLPLTSGPQDKWSSVIKSLGRTSLILAGLTSICFWNANAANSLTDQSWVTRRSLIAGTALIPAGLATLSETKLAPAAPAKALLTISQSRARRAEKKRAVLDAH
jgi:hypothetical protein